MNKKAKVDLIVHIHPSLILSDELSAAPPEPQPSPPPPAAPPHQQTALQQAPPSTPQQPPPVPMTNEEALAAFPLNKLNKLDELINNPR